MFPPSTYCLLPTYGEKKTGLGNKTAETQSPDPELSMRDERVICKIWCHPCTGSGQESIFTLQSIRCQVAGVGDAVERTAALPWKRGCRAPWHWEQLGTRGSVGRRAKDSCATWEEERKGQSFAASSFLFSYQSNSSLTLVLFKGKVLLSWAHCEIPCRNLVLCSGITPHQQGAAVTLGNCFPEL